MSSPIAQEVIKVDLNQLESKLSDIFQVATKNAMKEFMQMQDLYASLPLTMSLSEAERLTGIKAKSIKYYASIGEIKLIKPNGKYGKSLITKKEIMKLLM